MSFKVEAHGPWVSMKRVGRVYCAGCGLVRLHNPITAWCEAKGCNYEAHPGYPAALRDLTAHRKAS